MAKARRLHAVPDRPGRALIYVRVSALMGREGEDFHSPGMQTEATRQAIARAGLKEVGVIEDLDRSGQTFSREGIDKIRDMVEAKQVDVIALYDLSRLGRNLAESLTFIKWLRERHVSVMSTQERIDDTPEGQYMLGQFLGLAELYGAQVGRRWAQIVERRARAGKHHGVVPSGYLRVDKKMVTDPALGPAVTAVFEAYARGDYVSDIMAAFAAARGRPVHRSVIKHMLANPVYTGRVAVDSKTGGRLDTDGEHPALVDADTWRRVQKRLDADRRTPPRRLEARHSLTGLVWCAHCLGACQVWWSNEKGRVQRMVCARARQTTAGCPGIGAPLYTDIETVILDRVRAETALLTGNPGAVAAKIANQQRAGADAATIKAELDDTHAAMTRITKRWGLGKLPDAAYEGAMADLAATEELLTARLADADEVAAGPDPTKVLVLVDELMQMWPDMTEPERNRGLRAAVTRVYLRKAERWREPVADRVTGIDWAF